MWVHETIRVYARCTLAAVPLLLAAMTATLPLAADQAITVVLFGGSYARACEQAYHEPSPPRPGSR